jgi:hypothetical protein
VLQAKLERMALQIGYAATFMAILTVLVLVIAFSVEHFGVQNHDYEAGVWSEYLEVRRWVPTDSEVVKFIILVGSWVCSLSL